MKEMQVSKLPYPFDDMPSRDTKWKQCQVEFCKVYNENQQLKRVIKDMNTAWTNGGTNPNEKKVKS